MHLGSGSSSPPHSVIFEILPPNSCRPLVPCAVRHKDTDFTCRAPYKLLCVDGQCRKQFKSYKSD